MCRAIIKHGSHCRITEDDLADVSGCRVIVGYGLDVGLQHPADLRQPLHEGGCRSGRADRLDPGSDVGHGILCPYFAVIGEDIILNAGHQRFQVLFGLIEGNTHIVQSVG